MKKSFQKNLIAASVGAILAAGSMAAQAGTPGTDNLLFPFVSTVTTSFTFISIANRGNVAPATGVSTPLHFTYAMKAATAALSTGCVHLDGDAASTVNDLMQFEIQKKVDVPTAAADTTSVPKYFPNTAAAANQYGMLIVNNSPANNPPAPGYGSGATYVGEALYGEARIIDTSTGLAAGYSTDDLHTTSAAFPDFSLAAGPDGGVANSVKVISWFPDPAVSTSWYMLPLGTEQNMGAFSGGTPITVRYFVTANDGVTLGHYNNNELFQSSAASITVTCLGTVDRATLLGPLAAPFSANGGWGEFVGVDTTTAAAPVASLVYKMESTGAVGGTVNFITREPVL